MFHRYRTDCGYENTRKTETGGEQRTVDRESNSVYTVYVAKRMPMCCQHVEGERDGADDGEDDLVPE